MCCVAELTGAHMDDQRTIVAEELFPVWPGLGVTVTPLRGFDARNALRSGEHFGYCHTCVTLISYMQMLQGQQLDTGPYIMWVRLPLIPTLSRAEIKFGLNWLFSSAMASSQKAGLGWTHNHQYDAYCGRLGPHAYANCISWLTPMLLYLLLFCFCYELP